MKYTQVFIFVLISSMTTSCTWNNNEDSNIPLSNSWKEIAEISGTGGSFQELLLTQNVWTNIMTLSWGNNKAEQAINNWKEFYQARSIWPEELATIDKQYNEWVLRFFNGWKRITEEFQELTEKRNKLMSDFRKSDKYKQYLSENKEKLDLIMRDIEQYNPNWLTENDKKQFLSEN